MTWLKNYCHNPSFICMCVCVCVSYMSPYSNNVYTHVDIYLNIYIYAYILGAGNGTPLQYSCLETPMDGGAWQAAVHGASKSWTRLNDFTFTFHFMHQRRKWQSTPVFLPGESQGQGGLVGCHLWGRTESDMTEATQQQQQQFSLVAQLCPTLCDPMDYSMPGLPVHHQLPESTQTHVHPVGDAIQPSHPLSSPSPPAPNPSQHQGLFQ